MIGDQELQNKLTGIGNDGKSTQILHALIIILPGDSPKKYLQGRRIINRSIADDLGRRLSDEVIVVAKESVKGIEFKRILGVLGDVLSFGQDRFEFRLVTPILCGKLANYEQTNNAEREVSPKQWAFHDRRAKEWHRASME